MRGDHARLVTEINAELDRLAAQEQPWRATWVVEAICKEHLDGLISDNTDDRQFWNYCGRAWVRREVTSIIGRRAGDKTDRGTPRQIELPGFDRDHLQDYYMVTRNGEEVGIAVTRLTNRELEVKCRQLVAMADTCREHAAEIRRYLEWRANNASAAAE